MTTMRFFPVKIIYATLGSNLGGINVMKVSISLSDNLEWRKQQEQKAMVEACLLLDQLNDEDTEWQQAAIMDWEASGS